MRLWAERQGWADRLAIFIVEDRRVEDYAYPQPHQLLPTTTGYEWVRRPEGFAPAQASLDLAGVEGQHLFDQLWSQGYRPSHKIDEASRLEATRAHLEDMRTIAFDRLKVEKPTNDR